MLGHGYALCAQVSNFGVMNSSINTGISRESRTSGGIGPGKLDSPDLVLLGIHLFWQKSFTFDWPTQSLCGGPEVPDVLQEVHLFKELWYSVVMLKGWI